MIPQLVTNSERLGPDAKQAVVYLLGQGSQPLEVEAALTPLSDSGSYRFVSLNIRVEPLDYDCLCCSFSIIHSRRNVSSRATGSRNPSCLQCVSRRFCPTIKNLGYIPD